MQNTITRLQFPFARILLIGAFAMTLAACSAARIGFNNGSTISYWWLNSYVDFEGEQKPWVKRHIDELFAWHHKTQLRGYADFGSRIQRRDLSTVTQNELLADYGEGRKYILAITNHAAPELADLALSLTGEQIANVEEKLEKNNAKYRKDYLTGSKNERQEFRFKKMMKQAEYWFGDFSREQEAKLRAISDARPLNNELVLEDRLHRQKELVDLLKKIHSQKPGREEAARMIRAYIAAAENHFGNKEAQNFFGATINANANLVAEMMHMTTSSQRSHFVKTLQDWITDFNRMSALAAS
jgi:hypothetical protein